MPCLTLTLFFLKTFAVLLFVYFSLVVVFSWFFVKFVKTGQPRVFYNKLKIKRKRGVIESVGNVTVTKYVFLTIFFRSFDAKIVHNI